MAKSIRSRLVKIVDGEELILGKYKEMPKHLLAEVTDDYIHPVVPALTEKEKKLAMKEKRRLAKIVLAKHKKNKEEAIKKKEGQDILKFSPRKKEESK